MRRDALPKLSLVGRLLTRQRRPACKEAHGESCNHSISHWTTLLTNEARVPARSTSARTTAYGNTYALTATWRHSLPRWRQTAR